MATLTQVAPDDKNRNYKKTYGQGRLTKKHRIMGFRVYTSKMAILTGTLITIHWNQRYPIFGQTHPVSISRYVLQHFGPISSCTSGQMVETMRNDRDLCIL